MQNERQVIDYKELRAIPRDDLISLKSKASIVDYYGHGLTLCAAHRRLYEGSVFGIRRIEEIVEASRLATLALPINESLLRRDDASHIDAS